MTWPVFSAGFRGSFRRFIPGFLSAALMITGAYLAPPAQADPGVQPIVTGWLPYWFTTPAKPQGINAAVANADLFTEVSPFWYSATVGGPIGIQVLLNPNFTNGAANEAWAMGQLRAAGLKVLPSIADGTGKGRMAALLADSTRRAAHVQEIVNLVTSKGYDGIDLDYEGFAFNDGRESWAATQPLWRAFITELAAALHAQGKLLAVTIPPPCSMSGQCGPTSGYWVYDFANIAQQADRVRIMAYDYSVAGVGPIAPMPWVQAIVAYAAGAAPAQRVQIGVPTYGRAWTKKVGGKFQLSGTCPSSGKAYQSLTSMVSVTD
ncbi:MAG: glycosyl hydrolase family 18 protein, partial [Actinomycetales bacterium]